MAWCFSNLDGVAVSWDTRKLVKCASIVAALQAAKGAYLLRVSPGWHSVTNYGDVSEWLVEFAEWCAARASTAAINASVAFAATTTAEDKAKVTADELARASAAARASRLAANIVRNSRASVAACIADLVEYYVASKATAAAYLAKANPASVFGAIESEAYHNEVKAHETWWREHLS
jgi:hypothetical protein